VRARARAHALFLFLAGTYRQAGVVGQLNMAIAAGCGACACARLPRAGKGRVAIGKETGVKERGKDGNRKRVSSDGKEPAGRKRRRVLGVRFVWCALPSR